jgi:hypothetical protein
MPPSQTPSLSLKARAEAALGDPHFDFIAKYHAVADLRRLARQTPGILDHATICALEELLKSNAFRKVRQAYFLFRETAAVMTDMATTPESNSMGSTALDCLHRLLLNTQGSAHRGVAEALGNLPVGVVGPRPIAIGHLSPPVITWKQMVASSGLTVTATSRYIGRSLVSETAMQDHLLVVKLASHADTAAGLAKEARWMERLQQRKVAGDHRFDIPVPLTIDNQRVFRIRRFPLAPPTHFNRHPAGLAIAYVCHRDYFIYPNQNDIGGNQAREILARNAFLLGRQAAGGVIHDAPIPLFHNRTQRLRRDDQGRYQWFRSGRLDQWLDSCAFPNFGLSGLRDFEHLVPLAGGSRNLYRHIGSHIFSLLLVAGSHFRCRDKTMVGLDDNHQPADARHLFDRHLLKQMIREIFENYFTGFTGAPPPARLPADIDRLTGRMIEEMGVDRHMTELLRRADQRALTDRQFLDFLKARGYRTGQLNGLRRGDKDILITSGPHLGDFNRQISLPELIECTAAMAAVCMAGRFVRDSQRTPHGK